MVVRDREGDTADFQLEKLDADHVRDDLSPLIERESVWYTDGAAVYAAFAGVSGITHYVVHATAGAASSRSNLQHPECQCPFNSRLKNWMARFLGATIKYLINYLG